MENRINNALAAPTVQRKNRLLQRAINLTNRMVRRTNGCTIGGTPDNNDRIIECGSQIIVYQALQDLIDSIQATKM